MSLPMRVQSPVALYLRKLAEYLGLESTARLQTDPFALAYPQGQSYVVRHEVEEQVRQQIPQFIIGPIGSGKSSLFHILCQPMPQDLGEQRLVVPLSMAKARRFASIDKIKQGRESVLSFTPLAHAIFDAFWQDIVINKLHVLLQFRLLRQSEPWSRTFRHLYRRFRPDSILIADDPELIQWLENAPHEKRVMAAQEPQAVLNDLIQLILSSHHYMARAEEWYGPRVSYSVIDILVDDPETFSERGFHKLLEDAEAICTFYADGLSLKLFLKQRPGLEDWLLSRHCVTQGLAQVTPLPQWAKEELWDLLDQRVYAASERKYESFQQLVQILPSEAIRGSLRYNLKELIAQGALQVYQRNPQRLRDAPVHILQLAHEVVAAAAGCRPERYPPPIAPNNVIALIAEYWDKAAV
jgi:hypothetical protein